MNFATHVKPDIKFEKIKFDTHVCLEIQYNYYIITVKHNQNLKSWQREIIIHAISEGQLVSGHYHYTVHIALKNKETYWGNVELAPPTKTSFILKLQNDIYAKISSYDNDVLRQILIFDQVDHRRDAPLVNPSMIPQQPPSRTAQRQLNYSILGL